MTVALIALVIVEQIFIETTFNNLEEQVTVLAQNLQLTDEINTEQNLEDIEAIHNFWTVKEQTMCLTINHKDLDIIGEQINKLQTYIEENDQEYALYEVNVLIFYINSFQNVTSVSFKNVL
jgi:GH43 family beta-xylosidase